jgi:DNA-binding transcriptional MocR family regulator
LSGEKSSVSSTRLEEKLVREIAAEHACGALLHRARPAAARDRAAAASWLAARLDAAPDRIVIGNGTQALLRLLFEHLAQPPVVLAEALSYGVIKEVARLARVQLAAVPIDTEGLIPEALDELAARTGARVLYCNPTVHNPTTTIMSSPRRRTIGDIARRRGLTIIEDDVLGPLTAEAPPPIAASHADITWYLQSTAKALAHGLRVAFAVAPSSTAVSEVMTPVRGLSFWVPAPLGLEIVTRWVETGQAAQIRAAIRAEAAVRAAMARDALSAFGAVIKPGSFHVWLPTGSIGGAAFASIAAAHGITVRAGRDFAVADKISDSHYVRLSLSSPPLREQVERGLIRLARLLASVDGTTAPIG